MGMRTPLKTYTRKQTTFPVQDAEESPQYSMLFSLKWGKGVFYQKRQRKVTLEQKARWTQWKF